MVGIDGKQERSVMKKQQEQDSVNVSADKPVESAVSKEKMAKVVQAISANIGQVVELMRQSRAHRYLFIADLEWLVLPPVMLRQFRIYHSGNVPVAYVSWACVNEEVEQRIKAGNARLKPGEWNCGDRNWVMDLIAPAGKADEIIRNLRETRFKGRQLKTFSDLRKADKDVDSHEEGVKAAEDTPTSD